MAVFVLVHPAWFGGWCWKKLVPLLEERGHNVRTPTLTGLGERSHLAHPGIVMQTHIDDVASMLTYDDLREVILAGTSSSGAVISGVADRLQPNSCRGPTSGAGAGCTRASTATPGPPEKTPAGVSSNWTATTCLT